MGKLTFRQFSEEIVSKREIQRSPISTQQNAWNISTPCKTNRDNGLLISLDMIASDMIASHLIRNNERQSRPHHACASSHNHKSSEGYPIFIPTLIVDCVATSCAVVGGLPSFACAKSSFVGSAAGLHCRSAWWV